MSLKCVGLLTVGDTVQYYIVYKQEISHIFKIHILKYTHAIL